MNESTDLSTYFGVLTLQDFDDLMTVIRKHGFSEESERNKTAIVYYCRTGKSRTTLALAITGLVMCHLRVNNTLYMYIYWLAKY